MIPTVRPAVALVAAAAWLGACAAGDERAPAHPLAGTAWRLRAIQSMDDAQGTTRIPDPDLFTVRFDASGSVTLRLDCNRGTGTWQARAATRALCQPPHLDERVARDLPYVRGYMLRDGELFMSLMADAGIYEWQVLPR